VLGGIYDYHCLNFITDYRGINLVLGGIYDYHCLNFITDYRGINLVLGGIFDYHCLNFYCRPLLQQLRKRKLKKAKVKTRRNVKVGSLTSRKDMKMNATDVVKEES
jgi:hypothetical protein